MKQNQLGKREQKKEATRQKIICAAAEIFAEKGVAAASVSDITERAGLGIGTFYNYFSAKDDVLLEMTKAPVEAVREQMQAMRKQGATATEIVAAVSAAVAEFIDEHRFILGLFRGKAPLYAAPCEVRGKSAEKAQSPGQPQPFVGKVPGFKIFFEQIIREGQEAGEIRNDIPVAVMSEMFHAIYQAAAVSKIDLPYGQNVELKTAVLLDGMQKNNETG